MKSYNESRYIESLLSSLTLEEKIGMIHGSALFHTLGVPRLGIPALYMSDGPMGVRAEFADNEWRSIGTTEDFVSYLPCNSAIASAWNRALSRQAGEVLGEEARGRGKDVILAPGINIKRSPLCGRNFEYMSEDPRLIEELVVPMVQGIQDSDTAACVKHFAANSQETERLWVDTKVDERTLQEIYFPGFKAAVEKGGVYSLMGAYNLLNGEHCCTSKKLLNEELREKWGFDGTVISDWGGVHDTKEAAESALDIEMNVTYQFDEHNMAAPLLEEIRAGRLPESLVDEKVRNILCMMMRLNMIGDKRQERKAGSYNTKEHQETVLRAARESIILLKNEEQLLPLEAHLKKVAVIGANAAAIHSNGGGSAEIKALYEISPLMGIKKLLGGNAQVTYAPGYVIPNKRSQTDVNWQADSTMHAAEESGNGSQELNREKKAAKETVPCANKELEYRREALKLAAESDAVIFVGGLNHEFDVEGLDRPDMKLPYGQDELLSELLAVRPDTVVVIHAGSPVEMPWKDTAKAIVWSYYAGMEGGTALAEILFGKVNPSGKLAETFIKNTMQCPAHTIGTFGKKDCVEYKEGVLVGYRYYDTKQTDVNFCFGHGLSYSSFLYKDLKVIPAAGVNKFEVSLTVKNEGTRDGKETVQLYTGPENPRIMRPSHELKAFEKVELGAGGEKRIVFHLDAKDFSYYEAAAEKFITEPGICRIELGASSRDIRLMEQVRIQ